MKNNYNVPEMNIKEFNNEMLLTESTPMSAESKAIAALNEAGTTENITVDWFQNS